MSSESKATVAVIGATGNVGKTTISALLSGGVVNVRAIVRDATSDTATALGPVHLVQGDLRDPDTIAKALQDVSAVFIIVPSTEDRATLAVNAIDAAVGADVGHLVVLSVPTAGKDTTFGRQFGQVEKGLLESGTPYTLLRLPYFMDNTWGQLESLRSGKLFGPFAPDFPVINATLSDIGSAAARVLEDPAAHDGATYTLTSSSSYTHKELAAEIGRSIGSAIEYIESTFDEARDTIRALGVPEWQANGIIEMFQTWTRDDKPTGDVETILGRPAMTAADWVAANRANLIHALVGEAKEAEELLPATLEEAIEADISGPHLAELAEEAGALGAEDSGAVETALLAGKMNAASALVCLGVKWTPTDKLVWQCIVRGNVPAVAYCVSVGYDLAAATGEADNFTPIMAARHPGMVKFLARLGVNVNTQLKSTGESALHLATFKMQAGICKALVDAGADKTLTTKAGLTAFEVYKTQYARASKALKDEVSPEDFSALSSKLKGAWRTVRNVVKIRDE